MGDEIMGAHTEMGGMNDSDTTSAEVARGWKTGSSSSDIEHTRIELMPSLELCIQRFLHVYAFLPQMHIYPATSLGVCNTWNVIEFSHVR